MQAQDVKTADDARKLIQERDIKFVKIGVFDVDGIMRGKYMHRDKFLSALDSGFAFCDVVLGWDSNDQLYDKSEFTGWHTAYPDAPVRVIPESCRELPMEDDTILFLGEFEGRAETVCPRGTLRRVLDKASNMGYDVSAACEFEFFLFEETPHSVREKNYRNLTNITPGFYGYSMLRNSVHSEFYRDLLELGESMDFPIEGLHTETGPGVLEAAIMHDEALMAADKAALFKTFTKVLAQRAGWMATFMAKWSPDWPGQSGHMHVSIKGKDGRAAFYDADKPDNMSDEMRWFLGGQQKLMPELLSMVACTVNSYSRLVPGFWAPTTATWGVENRTTALRVIPGSEKSQRVEYRIAAADINPYIALSAAIGSGLWGIENKVEPGEMVVGNAYEQEFPEDVTLPATLFEAAGRLRKSEAAKSLFGEEFVTHYAQSREWEEREFRKAITDWELQRYFEII
ncbi:glutamine synthetase family protein [Thalassospira lucentensis]|uniref:Glutamine synthetase n=1 Tax=Thalassospira lucentensis TaxID=168935 RepID=A0A358HNR8_9PROT|nr:glutamine synthetase [Thalassospira lucentensis]HBU96829.1 glutamine synthetase [Thalassospira lucentensis]HCW66636.1 glutamine synthetase [Thalassospira lucentensis]|tara:strand:+ start:228 stop:1595 length:1368 start_codon:yes stop_codon:yes gene_type:complete